MTSAAPNVESRYASWLCENNSLSRNVPGWSGKGKHVQFQDREEIDKLLTYWEVLGQGSYAVVQRVTNRKGVPLALKIPRDADKYFEMIMDEVEHLNRLRHPHLVHLVGTFNVRRELSVLLYPAGEWNLKGFMEMIQYTKNPDPDSGEVRGLRKFFKCLSQAIHYIHQNTTKHLDLKPENFIVKQTLGPSENDLYRIFVADFGGAHNFINPDSSQASEKVYTTPVYMSPEIASRQRYGRACDIFSLGAVFTEMLTVSCGHSLEVYQSYRRHEMEDGVISLAYHSNISKVKAWVSSFTIDQTDGLRVIMIGDQKIETMILSMLDEVPGNRPKASQLLQYFSGGPCCGDMEAAYKSLVDSDSSDGGDDSDSDGPGDSGGNANNEDWDSNDGDQDDAFFSCSEGDVEDQTDNSHHGDAESQNKISSTYQSQIIARGLLPTRQLEFDWSGRGQHVDFAAGDVVPLTVLNVLDRGRINSVRCRRIKLCRKIIHLRRSGLKYPDEVLNEVEILQRLNHSHIVRLVGSYLQEKRLAVLTYPLADMNLGQLLDDISDNQNYHLTAEQFPLEMSLISGFQCLSHAVSHLHANAVEHMDIKPQNILVKKKRPHPGTEASPVWLPYKLYLCDFASARKFTLTDPESDEPIPRTPRYCSPEVHMREPFGPASDVFSLGCVFAEMLTVLAHRGRLEFANFRGALNDFGNESFQDNLPRVKDWMQQLHSSTELKYSFETTAEKETARLEEKTAALEEETATSEEETTVSAKNKTQLYIDTVSTMMERDPKNRPKARALCEIFPENACCSEESDAFTID